MKKLIILLLLSISTFTINSCSSDDNGHVEVIENYGNVNYRGYNIPLYYTNLEEIYRNANGIQYILEFSTNPLNHDGSNIGAYVYFEFFVEYNNNLSGEYLKIAPNFSRRELRLIEFHVDPTIRNNRVVASTYSEFNEFFPSGTLRLDAFDDGFLRANFRAVDQERLLLNGNFEGFERNAARKSNAQSRSNIQGTTRKSRSVKDL